MKKILVIASKDHVDNPKKRIHYEWIKDCSFCCDIDFWGIGYSEKTIESLKTKIDQFKPDFLYATGRGRCQKWLPDISEIKVPKIFVEIDSYKYNRNDSWYKQFDKIYSRQPNWPFKQSELVDENYLYEAHKIHIYNLNNKFSGLNIKFSKKRAKIDAYETYQKILKRIEQSKTWENTPLFRWSVSQDNICRNNTKRSGIYLIGSIVALVSKERYLISTKLKNKIVTITEWDVDTYHKIIESASALICSTDSVYGDYVPAKLFEFSASGAAILTNCDLHSYQMDDLAGSVIQYTDRKDMESKLDMDFTPYHDRSNEIMRNHTHIIRYKELFG